MNINANNQIDTGNGYIYIYPNSTISSTLSQVCNKTTYSNQNNLLFVGTSTSPTGTSASLLYTYTPSSQSLVFSIASESVSQYILMSLEYMGKATDYTTASYTIVNGTIGYYNSLG